MRYPISRFMTACPLTIGRTMPLATARAEMNRLGVRHLPVLHGGSLVGVLSLRDIELLESLPGVSAEGADVEEAMTQDVLAVAPDAPLDAVAKQMADRKLGSAVVVENDEVVGIFTTVDALRAIGELCAEATPPSRAATAKRSGKSARH